MRQARIQWNSPDRGELDFAGERVFWSDRHGKAGAITCELDARLERERERRRKANSRFKTVSSYDELSKNVSWAQNSVPKILCRKCKSFQGDYMK